MLVHDIKEVPAVIRKLRSISNHHAPVLSLSIKSSKMRRSGNKNIIIFNRDLIMDTTQGFYDIVWMYS